MAKTGLNLDTLALEGRPEPYTFTLAGREWIAVDPETVDWQVIEDIDQTDPRAILRVYLGDDVYEEFVSLKVPNYAVKKLLGELNLHYADGLEPGEGDGSPTS